MQRHRSTRRRAVWRPPLCPMAPAAGQRGIEQANFSAFLSGFTFARLSLSFSFSFTILPVGASFFFACLMRFSVCLMLALLRSTLRWAVRQRLSKIS